MTIECVKLDPNARDLYRSTDGSAGFDISICDEYQHAKMAEVVQDDPRKLKDYPGVIPIQYIEQRTQKVLFNGKIHNIPTENELIRTVFYVDPGKTALIHTGLIVEIPDGYVGLLVARSGISNNFGITPKDCIGIIDSDYRGELMIHLVNNSQERYYFAPHERVCQLIVVPYLSGAVIYKNSPSETSRGVNGYGSTGKN